MRRVGRTLLRLAGIPAAIVIAWVAGLIWFAGQIPEPSPAGVEIPAEPTDAIVVLTGGSSRLRAGLALLAEGRARKLFVSGVYRGVDVSELLRVARQEPAAVECCIALGYAADNTAGNAVETREWMLREGFKSIRLVTANYHMRRSLLEFHRAMPEMTIVPHHVLPDNFERAEWWWRRATLELVVSEYDKYLAALARPALAAVLPWIENP
jgi:uncharacterized SAM-binding protein YcdF (DUF218 family)